MKELTLNKGYVAFLDDADHERIIAMGLYWYAIRAHKNSDVLYARADGLRGKGQRRPYWYLHRLVLMDVPKGMQIDHRNRDGLDCQRHNLRIATHAQNQRNKRGSRDGLKGVWYDSRPKQKLNPWRSQITVDRRNIRLGCFGTEEEAAQAYDRAARQYHGDFARLNFPER